MTQPFSFPTRATRRGVSLLELLVVLAILGIASAVAVPLLRVPGARAGGDEAANARAELVASVRRVAVTRGERVRLRLAGDGVWALVSAHDGTLLRDGRIAAVPGTGALTADERRATELDLTIDALGSCTPVVVRGRAFDPVRCEAVAETAARVAPERRR